MDVPFHTLDVFTDIAFGGNPLAVFPEAAPLAEHALQSLALEMNLSETVFLFPPESGGVRKVRIFTPITEVPFAGHPTVGTAFFLAATGALDLEDAVTRIVLEESVGPVPVEIFADKGSPVSTRLETAIPPEHRPAPYSATDLARLLSLPDGAVAKHGLNAEFVSFGLPFLVVPVADLEAARRSRLDLGVWESLLSGAWSQNVYVVTLEAEGPGVDAHVRMFAPGAGIVEDPATGSAGAALAAYLGARAGVSDGTLDWRLEQGIEMGRPSVLEIQAELEQGNVRCARVGGRSVLVSRPDDLIRP